MVNKDQSILTGAELVSKSAPYQSHKRNIGLVRMSIGVCTLVISILLTACSPSASNLNPTVPPPAASVPQQTAAPTTVIIPTATSVAQNTTTPAPALNPLATSGPQQAAVNTPLDPCVLISSQEASTLAGASFGTGKESTTPEGMKSCTYGAQTTNVFAVDVIQAPDLNTAKSYKAQFLADLQAQLQQLTSQGLNVTEMPNFADGAVMADANINTGTVDFSGRAIGFLKGTVFFGFSDLVVGGAAPGSAAVQSEATSVLGRLP